MERFSFDNDEIKEFLSGLKFHKALMGVREDSVFEAMKQLDAMYREKLEECQAVCDKSFERIERLESELAEARAQTEKQKQREKASAGASEQYEAKAEQITRVIEGIENVREELLSSARAEADEILSGAKADLRQEEETRRLEIIELETIKKNALSSLETVQNTVRSLSSELASLQSSIDRRLDAGTGHDD